MPFWRRDEPAHEKLAREAGLNLDGTTAPERQAPIEPRQRFPFVGVFREPGVHGIHRQREWDIVATVDAPGLVGDRQVFVALPDSTLLIEDGPGGELDALSAAVEGSLEPPYRAEAVRQTGEQWAVAANQIELVEVPEVAGDEISLSVVGMERELLIDGIEADERLPQLQELAAQRYDSYALTADRLDGDLFEVEVSPL